MHAPASETDLGVAGEVASRPLPTALTSHHAGPGGNDGSSNAEGPRDHHLFALSVPFPSPLEAEIACGALAPDAEPHRIAVQKDLGVLGSVLTVRWRAASTRVLRMSIVTFLDQLALVVRTLQRFGPAAVR